MTTGLSWLCWQLVTFMVRFAHIGDPHLGSWNNHPDMRDYPLAAFREAIDVCINSGIDFIIISGDLFDTSIPSIDVIRSCFFQLRRCKENGMRVYAIPGSHDFSPTGKTILSVAEDAGLIVNVAKTSEEKDKIKLKFTEDKTGAKITGMIGRKSCLEKSSYEILDRGIENERGFKIFVFHSAIEKYRPVHMKEMDAIPLELFPKNFDYYAGGHVHHRFEQQESGYGTIAFPGALFPTSFDELEKCAPGFYIVRYDEKEKKLDLQWFDLSVSGVKSFRIDAEKKTAKQVEKEIKEQIEKTNIKDNIILLRVEGLLQSGLPSDIDFKAIISKAMARGARTVKRSISRLATKEFEEVSIVPDISIDELEKKIIEEHLDKIKFSTLSKDQLSAMVFDMMNVFKEEKIEGETNTVYDERIKANAKKVLGL